MPLSVVRDTVLLISHIQAVLAMFPRIVTSIRLNQIQIGPTSMLPRLRFVPILTELPTSTG